MTAATEGQKPAQKRRRHGRSASFFFWLTIGLLLAGTAGLAVLGAMRQAPAPEQVAQTDASSEDMARKRTRFEDVVVKLPQQVRAEIEKGLDEALDRIFQPAFAGIPGYADFHYSLRGEYTELVGTALLRSESELQRRVFNGLDERLKTEAEKLDQKFVALYTSKLQDRIAEREGDAVDGEFDSILTSIQTDLMQRVRVTAPLASAASTVTVLAASKLASKTVAKKIGATIAKKAAAKGSTKLGGILTGAGSGAAACSPGGPIAAACGIGGAVVAWLVVDKTVIELDEYFNRKEFEQTLRDDIQKQKDLARDALKSALAIRGTEMERVGKRVVRGHFTQRDLAKGGSAAMCEKAKELLGRYDALRSNAALRLGTTVSDLREEVEELQTMPALSAIAGEMLPVLTDKAAAVELYGMAISGYLPPDLRENRDLSGTLSLNDVERVIERFEASADVGFGSPLLVWAQRLRPDEVPRVKLTLEQHRRLLPNRHFTGETTLPVDKLIGDLGAESETTHHVQRNLILGLDEDGDGKRDVGSPLSTLELRVVLRAQSLPPITAKGCPAL